MCQRRIGVGKLEQLNPITRDRRSGLGLKQCGQSTLHDLALYEMGDTLFERLCQFRPAFVDSAHSIRRPWQCYSGNCASVASSLFEYTSLSTKQQEAKGRRLLVEYRHRKERGSG